MCSAPLFQVVIRPCGSSMKIAWSLTACTSSWNCCSLPLNALCTALVLDCEGMGATEIQRRMRLNADGSTGGNTASSIALRSLVGGVRQTFQLVMAAPACNVSTPLLFQN